MVGGKSPQQNCQCLLYQKRRENGGFSAKCFNLGVMFAGVKTNLRCEKTKGEIMEAVGYVLEIAEVLVVIVLVWQVDKLKSRIKALESKEK